MPTTSIGPITISSETVWDGKLAFVATDASGGPNVYVSDGTAAGTVKVGGPYWVGSWIGSQQVGDLTPLNSTALYFRAGMAPYLTFGGAGDAVALAPTQFTNPNQGADWPTLYNGKLYFDEYTTQYGTGIYATDGVNVYYEGGAIAQGQPVVLNGKLIFPGEVQDSSGGYVSGIYSSNGTQTGTVLLNSVVASGGLVLSGSKVFFVAQAQGTNEWDLWVSDGTSTGTKMVAAIAHNAGMAPAPALTAVSGGVMWSADDGTHGVQPWFSNGTAAGTYILDINTQPDPSASIVSTQMADANGKVLFMTPGGGSTSSVWISDGATSGTQVIATLGSSVIQDGGVASWTAGGETYFQVSQDLWATDGTSAGTKDLGSIGNLYLEAVVDGKLCIGTSTGLEVASPTGLSTVVSGSVSSLIASGDVVYFTASGGANGAGTYGYNALTGVTTFVTSDPLGAAQSPVGAAGSKLVYVSGSGLDNQLMAADAATGGVANLGVTQVANLAAGNGLVYFTWSNLGSGAQASYQLWVTDGTAAGSHSVSDSPNGIEYVVADGADVYYMALSATFDKSIYCYDATTGATTLVGPTDDIYTRPVVVGGVAFLERSGALYRLDPTGESLITSATVRDLTAIGSKFVFAGGYGSTWNLYVSDGTEAGTTALCALPDLSSVDLSNFAAVGNQVYFENSDPVNGTEIWVTDGTVAGTHRVTNTTTSGPGSAYASGYVSVGTTTYFTATDGLHGQELWTLNGSGSASMVADINPGAADSNPAELTAFGGALYFVATAADGIAELWKTTGAGANQITSTSNGAHVEDLAAAGGKLYFFGSDSVHGSGLFVSDGTSAGTTFLKVLSQASAFYAVGNELYFNAAQGASGLQLWKSDGTAAGTVDVTGAAGTPNDSFNGDGRSDLLIQNASGAVVVGEAGANGSETYTQVGGLGPEWRFRGTGDFLGLGQSQFLIETTTGALYAGEVQGGKATYTQLATLGSEWSFAGTGDYLGDGKSDFLIENTTGAIVVGEAGSTGKAAYTQVGQLGAEWKFAGSGDFLGEGHAQFLIENTKGAVVAGDVQGGKAVYTQVATLGSEWAFVGAGDFLGDGKTDMLIENAKGAIVVGEIGTGGQTSWTQVGLLGSEWKFVGAGDFQGLGRDQFLIENTTGAVVAGAVSGGKAAYAQLGALGSEWAFRM